MKKIKYILFLTCIISSPFQILGIETGSIMVTSIPEKATITLNKTINGKAGEKFIDLEPGNYQIEVFIETRNLDIEILNQYLKLDVELKASEELYITADFTKNSIKVDSINLIVIEETKVVEPVVEPEEEQVFFIVEDMPKFQGGDKALQKFISDSIVYPQEAKDKGITGRVFVRFVITKNGKVDKVSIARGVDTLLDAAAVDVISKMPDWEPGRQRGKTVNVWYTAPINFVMDKKPEKLPSKEEIEKFDSLFNLGISNFNLGKEIIKENVKDSKEIKDFPEGHYKDEIAKANKHFETALPYLEEAHKIDSTHIETMNILKELYLRFDDLNKFKKIMGKLNKQ